MPHEDHIVLATRFLVIYGSSWVVVASYFGRRGIFERTAVAVIIVHLCAYLTFLAHFLIGFSYTPISSLVVFGFSLYMMRLLLSDMAKGKAEMEKEVRNSKPNILIWCILLSYFLMLYYSCSYRIAVSGAAYHSALDLWKFNRDTLLSYPDVEKIGYSLVNMPLFHHPLFYANGLLLNCGVYQIDNAISGFGLMHFVSIMTMMLFIHLLLKRLTNWTIVSFACLLLFATWRPNGGYSYLFMPDYNSFVGVFTLASFYYLVRCWKCFTIVDCWLLFVSLALGVNNRIWMAPVIFGLMLPFSWRLLRGLWAKKEGFCNIRTGIVFGVTLFIGVYWSLFVYGLGADGGAAMLYQSSLLTGAKSHIDVSLFKLSSFLNAAVSAAENVHMCFFSSYFRYRGGYFFLPGYISVMGVLGMGVFAWKYREGEPVFRVILGICLAVYITALVTPVGYPRAYLWLIYILLFFATLLINEISRYILAPFAGFQKMGLALGLGIGLYLNLCGIAYISRIERAILRNWNFSPTPGMYPFYQDVNTLRYLREDSQKVADAVSMHMEKKSKTLHLIIEPGSDLDAFLKGTYWWENYYFFPGARGQSLMESIFEKYMDEDVTLSPCSLMKHRISLIDVPVNFNDLIKYRHWTSEQIRVISTLKRWMEQNPDVFKVVACGHAGRRVYFVDWEGLGKKFGCRRDAETWLVN